MRKLYTFLGLIVLFIIVLETKVNAQIEVTNWDDLENTIENSEELNIEVKLSSKETKTWIANNTISIISGKNVTIIADDDITITRDSSFKKAFIENNGKLTIEGKDENKKIIFDGNGQNVEATSCFIKNYFSYLNLKNVVLQNNNKPNGNGGAIYIRGCKLKADNCEILNNKTTNGGAIYIYQSGTTSIELNNSNIEGNRALDGFGGAICNSSNPSTYIYLKNTNIKNNSAEIKEESSKENYGGAIYACGNLRITNGEISENTARRGGAIYLENAKLIIKDTKINKNSTVFSNKDGIAVGEYVGQWGGAICTDIGSTIELYNADIYENESNSSGGAIFLKDGTIGIYKGTKIHNNKSQTQGGAIRLFGAENVKSICKIESGEIYENEAKTSGGGISLISEYTTVLMAGGNIHDNIAGTNGNEVYIENNGLFYKNDNGTIKNDVTGSIVGDIIEEKTEPNIEVTYGKIAYGEYVEGMVVEIKSDKEMQELEGWYLSNNKNVLMKTYWENTKNDENIEVKDFMGNKATITVRQIVEINKSNNDNVLKRAIQEVAYSYFMRGSDLQYNSAKIGPSDKTLFSPEEATSQNTNYLVCSAFTKAVYSELLGVTIPEWTESLISYGKNYKARPEVIAYGYRDKNFEDKNNDNNDDVLSISKAKLNANRKEFNSNIGDVLMWFNDGRKKTNPNLLNDIIPYLKVGDVITFTGHTMMIYDLIYDNNNNVIDAITIEVTHGNSNRYIKTRSFSSGNYRLHYNQCINTIPFEMIYGCDYTNIMYEGCVHFARLSASSSWKTVSSNDPKSNLVEYSILRFLSVDPEGNILLNYNDTISDKTTNYKNKKIDLSDKDNDRMKFSKLYIEKTVDVHADDIVEEKDELTYKIVIKNNSENAYTDDINIMENISEYVTYKNGSLKANDISVKPTNISKNDNEEITSISYNIGKLGAKQEVIIKYSVTVNEKTRGETIESTGMVEHISSSTVKNKIGSNLKLTKEQEEQFNNINLTEIKIKDENENEIQATGQELINEIYKKVLGIDLHFDEFDITNLIINKSKAASNGKKDLISGVSLNKENIFYGSILNKYWGTTLYDTIVNNGNDEPVSTNGYAFHLKRWRENSNENRRADTIYSENFKTGDILVYINTKDQSVNENGKYAYIYIEGKGFIGINNGNNYSYEYNSPDPTDGNKKIGYTVEYYKDNVLVVGDTENVVQYVESSASDELELNTSLINNNSKYQGYEIDHVEQSELGREENKKTFINNNTVIKVYYKTKSGTIPTSIERNTFDSTYYTQNNISVYSTVSEAQYGIEEYGNYQTLFGKDYYVILRPSLMICNINYELDGGENSKLNPDIYFMGESKELQNPTKQGYVFKGWYLDKEYTDKITKLDEVESDITLYAKWDLQVREITIKEGTVPETCILGQDLDLSNAKIEVTYEIGETKEIEITKEMLGESFNKNKLGLQTVTVTYGDKTATFNVTVIEELELQIKGMDEEKSDGITYLSTTDQNITEAQLKSKIITNGDITIEAKGPNGEIGTGSKIKISKNGKTLEYTLIIMGDLTGDGLLDDRDLLKMARYGVNIDKSLTGAYLKAGNIVKDNSFGDDRDLLKLARIMVKLDNFQ